jgi:hypothetical protein
MHPSPDHGYLLAFARAADTDLARAGVDGAILRVSALAPVNEAFTWFPLEGTHPLEVLLGFVAPPHWQALGVSCPGYAHRLDAHGRVRHDASGVAVEPDDVSVTVLVDRGGSAAGVLRRGAEAADLPGRPEGAVADACRRALGLPTSPPPPSSLGLWTLAWLDRVVEAAGRADAESRLRSWSAVAGLHAAAGPPGDHEPAAALAPAALAGAAGALAMAWPWGRLRDDPAVVDVPGPPPSAELAGWMDDGMWARWMLSRLPAADDLMAAVRALLPPVLADGVELVAGAAWE